MRGGVLFAVLREETNSDTHGQQTHSQSEKGRAHQVHCNRAIHRFDHEKGTRMESYSPQRRRVHGENAEALECDRKRLTLWSRGSTNGYTLAVMEV